MTSPDRLPPPHRSDLDAATNELLDLAVTPRGETAATIAVLAHNPALVGPFLGWAAALHLEGCLLPRHHEILALRTAHNCGSDFEWVEHLGWAQQAGLRDDEIEAIAARDDLGDPVEAALLDAADQLHEGQDLTDDTLQALIDGLGAPGAMEVAMVVGQYAMLSMLANAAGLPAPEEVAR